MSAQTISCECDYDCVGDPLEYVKTSRYCPLHDDCEACGERLGVMKDPDFATGYRAMWICAECRKEDQQS